MLGGAVTNEAARMNSMPRERVVAVRLTETEYRRLRASAKKDDRSLGSVLRLAWVRSSEEEKPAELDQPQAKGKEQSGE